MKIKKVKEIKYDYGYIIGLGKKPPKVIEDALVILFEKALDNLDANTDGFSEGIHVSVEYQQNSVSVSVTKYFENRHTDSVYISLRNEGLYVSLKCEGIHMSITDYSNGFISPLRNRLDKIFRKCTGNKVSESDIIYSVEKINKLRDLIP